MRVKVRVRVRVRVRVGVVGLEVPQVILGLELLPIRTFKYRCQHV